MNKKEAKFQTVFNQYLRKKKLFGYFELKEATGDSLPFSAIKQHQLNGLLAASRNGFVWKLSDQDQREKPFDCMYTKPAGAYVVIKYGKVFYIITAQMFHFQSEVSESKSLTKQRAKEISTYEVYM